MSESMTRNEFIAGCQRLVRNDGHGWITQAADALCVSRKSVQRAADAKTVTEGMAKKLRDALVGVETIEARDADIAFAGAWSVGEPEALRRDPNIIAESVVTHLHTPAFVLHLTLIRGKDAIGEQVTKVAARWFEEPSSASRRNALLEKAEAKGRAFAIRIAQAKADRESRERVLDAAEKVSGLDRSELKMMSDAQLITAKRGGSPAEMREARVRVSALIQEAHDEEWDGSREACNAFRSGIETGKRIQLLLMCDSAEVFDSADIAEMMWARHVAQVDVARTGTVRGDRG